MAQAALEIDRISKRYGEHPAIHELDLRVDAGELVGLVGNPGAGKTTTMRIAAGVLAPDSGSVRWAERPVEERALRIGYLPAERGLYPQLRLVEHLVYLGELHGLPVYTAHRNAETWLERFGLRGHRSHPLRTLTPANQQKALLAIALIAEPELLVLDEPFTDLDPLGVEVLGNVLREKADAGAAVLFSCAGTEIPERLCDRIGILHRGRLAALGTAEELQADEVDTLVVDAPDAPPGWADELPGTRVRGVVGSRVVLELEPGVDDQDILTAALSTGPVREFSRRRCPLTDRFEQDEAQERGRGGRAW